MISQWKNLFSASSLEQKRPFGLTKFRGYFRYLREWESLTWKDSSPMSRKEEEAEVSGTGTVAANCRKFSVPGSIPMLEMSGGLSPSRAT
jgi:hypothetical protein